ncbi:hypothetical protein AMATHDRAFT_71378 [Amanita thiersii Skay4041]|uniref:Uncharacterized protein n=1 Tax=Amanita thiersii Skay4041 TaxID=703135 RepID=A0A2A9NCV9_9AGAR|nr:hypothetical protein AMATHDRAFT_71378 [Amanita thiersii Skay4041]
MSDLKARFVPTKQAARRSVLTNADSPRVANCSTSSWILDPWSEYFTTCYTGNHSVAKTQLMYLTHFSSVLWYHSNQLVPNILTGTGFHAADTE